MSKIGAATRDVREMFDTEYGLATRRIATDGIDEECIVKTRVSCP